MFRFGEKTIILFTLATLFAVSFLRETNATSSERPSGFSGYLLDTTGLEPQKAESAWHESFESQGISWRYLYQDGSIKRLKHERVNTESHGEERSEFLQYEVEEPGVVVLGHYVDYTSIFAETSPSVWVRSDRPGVSIAALVVFPKTIRPDTGKPLTALLAGSTYQKPGEWQRLDFPEGLDKLIESTTRAIRGEHKIPVNRDCAYIRQIALLTEARHGRYSIWIDDLEIEEHIKPAVDSLRRWEQRASFDPINLLSSRLELSQTPIFWQNEEEEFDVYGKEPFAIDRGIVEKKKNRLNFVDVAGSPSEGSAIRSTNESTRSNVETNTLVNLTEGFGSTINQAKLQPSFDEASLFIPTIDDELAPFSQESVIAQNQRNENVISTQIDEGAPLEQTTFLNENKLDAEKNRIRSATYDPIKEENEQSNDPEYLAFRPIDVLVSGSGTLNDPEDAVSESFVTKGGKLVADASFQHGVLTTKDERIYFIRAIEYQGEPFEFLKKLGFNAVWLNESPSAATLKEANDVGIWLIAEPPVGADTVAESALEASGSVNQASNGTPSNSASQEYFGGRQVNNAYDAVLLWNLGRGLRREKSSIVKQHIAKLRALDPLQRPIVASVSNGVDEYSQEGSLDAMLLDRAPLLTSLDLNDYGEWLLSYQNLLDHPKFVVWNKIQTEPSLTATMQRRFFGVLDETPGVISYEQIRQLVRLSMRAGCRGLVFSSSTRLDSKDRPTQYRATALEAINLELQFLAPWYATGDASKSLLETSSPELSGIVSRTKRSVLITPISRDKDNQYVMGQDAVYNWSATVATREGYSPDLLTPGALRKLLSKRRAGGSWFSLDEGSMNSLIFYTQSDALSQKMSERAPTFGRRMAELAIDLARKRLDLYEKTVYALKYVEEHGSFPLSAPRSPNLGSVIEKALAQLEEAELSLSRRDVSQAYLIAERATREIRNAERNFWEEATRTEVARPVTPLSCSFYDMPAYLELYEKLLSGKIKANGENLIKGGDMESPSTWHDEGWVSYQETSPLLKGVVSFESYASRTGPKGLGLRIEISSQDPNVAPVETECPLICVETSFPSRVGQIICFQGWIKIPYDLTSSTEGVEIYDDQGGEALALRFKKKCDWKRFAFYRLSTNDGPMRIRFAFSGVGEVYLDDVAAYVVQ